MAADPSATKPKLSAAYTGSAQPYPCFSPHSGVLANASKRRVQRNRYVPHLCKPLISPAYSSHVAAIL
jgi:hypothetical protein